MDLLTDRFVCAESKRIGSCDNNFFIFEDLVKECMLVFSRDAGILDDMHCPRPRVPTGKLAPRSGGGGVGNTGKKGDRKEAVYPPNGVLPFLGIGYYIAPLCFLYSDSAEIYTVFRAMYKCSVFDIIFRSRMALSFTPLLRLKR
jgi:hypothetical protein